MEKIGMQWENYGKAMEFFLGICTNPEKKPVGFSPKCQSECPLGKKVKRLNSIVFFRVLYNILGIPHHMVLQISFTTAAVDRLLNLNINHSLCLSIFQGALEYFLNDRSKLQMAALYAVQVFCYRHQFPKGKL